MSAEVVALPLVGPFAGWAERDQHLVDDHGADPDTVDSLDSDAARGYHRYLHDNARPARRHLHRGGW